MAYGPVNGPTRLVVAFAFGVSVLVANPGTGELASSPTLYKSLSLFIIIILIHITIIIVVIIIIIVVVMASGWHETDPIDAQRVPRNSAPQSYQSRIWGPSCTQ